MATEQNQENNEVNPIGTEIINIFYQHLSSAFSEIVSSELIKDNKLPSSLMAYYLGEAFSAKIYDACAASSNASVHLPSYMTLQHLPQLVSGFINQLEHIKKTTPE